MTNQRTMELVNKEVAAKSELNHQNISKYYGLYENSTLKNTDGTETPVTYIVEEPILGGELFDHVMDKGGFSENMCRHFFKQILEAVCYVHDQGYAHRDLKLENILLDTNFNVKLIDFGFATKLTNTDEEGFMTTICGTPHYMAPEMHEQRKYKGKEVDVFALGVILLAMRACQFPFKIKATKGDHLYTHIANSKFDTYWQSIGQGK